MRIAGLSNIRHPVAGILLILILLGFMSCKRAQPICTDANIIFISIDCLRTDHLGRYGYSRNTSPHFDRFVDDAVLFNTCISQCTSTLASHSSMLTSLIPEHHGAFFTRNLALPAEVQTMAEILKENGYKTVSFNDGGQIAPRFALNQGFDLYESTSPQRKYRKYTFRRIVKKSMDWIERNPQEKFFMFLHTYETHHPYEPKKEDLELFEQDYSGKLPDYISVDLINRINRGTVQIDDQDLQHLINTYDAEIKSMDRSLGRFLEFLKEKGLYEDTIIIFTSDHGEEFGEHELIATHSNSLFNEQIRVPLAIKFCDSQYSSREIDSLVRSIDILPTMLEAVGVESSAPFEGVSLAPLIQGKTDNLELLAISQRDMRETKPEFWSIMNEKWKLYNGKLYDLENDPQELIDQSADHADLKAMLWKHAEDYLEKDPVQTSNEKVKLSDGLKEKLKSLGYIK
jgi:arylsulfatase A-like enzyme